MKRILFIICIIALVACTKKGPEQKGPYLAKVDKATITKEDFDTQYEALPDYAKEMFEGADGKERFLKELVKKEMLYQEALAKGYEKDDSYLKKLEEFKKLTLISLLFEKEVMKEASVSDLEVKDFFDKNKAEFTTTSQLRASHILVGTEDEAKKVLERLKKGNKFENVAKAVSIDKASAKNGGDLGYFSRGQMVPEFERAALNLKVGEMSEPVKTAFGYHIIKLTDRKEGPAVEFDRVKEMIRQKLANDKQKQVFDSYVANLDKKYKVEINNESLKQLSHTEEKTQEPAVKAEEPAKQEPVVKTEEPTKQEPAVKTEEPAKQQQTETKKAEEVKPAETAAPVSGKPDLPKAGSEKESK